MADDARPYGGPWRRKIRPRILARDPWCPGYPQGSHDCPRCGARYDIACAHRERVRTTSVDHRTPLVEGGTDHEANLRGLCSTCNARKGHDEGRARKGPRGRHVGDDGPHRIWREV